MSEPSGISDIHAIIGPLFLGLVFSIGFQGILLAQAYLYWRTYSGKDSRFFQILVFGLCALELLHCAVTTHAGYWYLVSNYGNSQALDNLVWSIITELGLTVLITFIGRCFWITWLFLLSRKNWWLTAITSAFSLAQLGLGIGEVYEGVHSPFFHTIVDGKVAIISQMVSADVGDLIISISLCYYLNTQRTGITRTERLIDRLVMFVVTRGLLATGSGGLQLISYVVWPTTFIFGFFHLLASKLYTNALMATLNSREELAGSRQDSSRCDTGPSFVLSSVVHDTQIRGPFEPKGRVSTDDNMTTHLRAHTDFLATVGTSSSISQGPSEQLIPLDDKP